MSEFFDAHTCHCPYCGKSFASCEGPECDCLLEAEFDKRYGEPKEAGLEDYYELEKGGVKHGTTIKTSRE